MRRPLPSLNALRAFEAAARHRSFKQAAEELGVTPTAISHQIRELEQGCGQALFRRHPRPLALTAAGAQLFPVLRDGLDGFAAAFAALRPAPARQAPLRVTTTNAFAHLWLVPRLAGWHAARPDIPLEVIGTDRTLDLRAGQAELAIRYMREAPPGLAAREILRDRFYAMAHPALLSGGAPLRDLEALLRLPRVHMRWDPLVPNAPTWETFLRRAGRPALVRAAMEEGVLFQEELHAMQAAASGQGVAICSDVLTAREQARGMLLTAYPLELQGFGFWLARLPEHPRGAEINAFITWVTAEAAVSATA